MKHKKPVMTAFPKGTIVKYNGIPCKLLQDTPYYSETYKSTQPEIQSGEAVVRQKLKDQRDLCWAAAWGIVNGKIDIELEEKLAEAITNAEEPNF